MEHTTSRKAARTGYRFVAAVAVAVLTIPFPAGTHTRPTRRPAAILPNQPAQAEVGRQYGNLPLAFEPNMGQTDARVRFLARGGGMTAFFTDTETAMVLSRSRQANQPEGPGRKAAAVGAVEQTVVRMKLEKGSRPRRVAGTEQLPGVSNYFIGNDPAMWHTDVPHYARIQYQGVYPGIDLVWYGNQRRLEYDFMVSPGADPKQIQVAYEGAESMEVAANGDLVLHTALGEVRQQKPRVYQQIGGKQVEVAAQYSIGAGNRVGFQLASYDRKRELRIDPVMLLYSTYLGGNGDEYGFGIAVDSAGSAYATGLTQSTNFPTLSPYQAAPQGNRDVFVTKLTPAGNALVYSTYLGGSNDDYGYGIAVDAAGSAYVTGLTQSANFPTLSPFQSTPQGGADAFVAKLSPAGNALMYATYLGGASLDYGTGIAVDTAGSAYVSGKTQSANFPTLSAFQATLQGFENAFVAKLSPAGSALVYSTYLGGAGGSGVTNAFGIAVDSANSAYVTGSTNATNFPTLSPYQAIYQGSNDAFVTKLTAAGNALVYSTYLGGAGYDYGYGIALDTAGSAYITGITQSSNFPTLSPYQAALQGAHDVFVTKLMPAGNGLVYSTYLGGSNYDTAQGIAVDGTGAAYVTGFTVSNNFPAVSPYQATFQGVQDAFVTKLTAAGSALVYSTYLGGNSDDAGYGIAVDSAGSAYVTGRASSANFPTQSPYQATLQGVGDAFVTKLSAGNLVTADSVSPSSGNSTNATLTAVYSDTAGFASLGTEYLLINTAVNGSNACYLVYQGSNNTLMLANDAGTAFLGPIGAGTGSTLQNSQCILNGIGSSGVGSGNSLNLTVSLSFKAAFAGSKTVFLNADGGGVGAGWQSRGTWTVPGGAVVVTADSVSPSSGSTTNATLTAVYSDTAGFANLAHEYLLINTGVNGSNACYVTYQGSNNTLMLANDAGTAFLGPIVAGTGGTLQNSQCILNGTGSSGVGSGNSLSLTVSLSFKAAFAGSKTVFLNADGGGVGAGWQSRGTWTVPGGGAVVVTADSVSPSSGNTTNATLTAVYSDTAGFTNLAHEYLLINTAVNGANACYVTYQGSNNTLMLASDAGNAFLGPIVAGTNATLQNSQCILNGIGSSGVGSGNSLTVTVSLSFKAAFAGSKNVFLNADGGGVGAGWQSRGIWTVPGAAVVVTADSVSPSSGNTTNATLTAVYSDTAGFANLGHEYLLINTAVNGANACYVVYQGSNNTLLLANDAGNAFLGPIVAGTNATLQNSQCILNGIGSSGVGSGNSLTLTVSLTFMPAFTGGKTVFLNADGGGVGAGWQSRGTWTVP